MEKEKNVLATVRKGSPSVYRAYRQPGAPRGELLDLYAHVQRVEDGPGLARGVGDPHGVLVEDARVFLPFFISSALQSFGSSIHQS